MYLSRTTTKIAIVIFFVFLSGYSSLQDGINQDPLPESFIQSKTNWIKTLFARGQFLPNLDFGVKANAEPQIIPGDKIIDKGEKVKDKIIDKGEKVKEKIIPGDKIIDKGEKANDEPQIIPGDKIIDKGEKVKEKIIPGDKIIDKGEKAKDDVTMTFSEGITTLEETAKPAAETTKDKIYQAAINVKETIFPPHDDHNHDEPNHEL